MNRLYRIVEVLSLTVSMAVADQVWVTQNPKLSASQFASLHWDGKQYLAIGQNTEIGVSSDGRDWKSVSGFIGGMPVSAASNSDSSRSLSYVLDIAPPQVLLSEDGEHWVKDTSFPISDYFGTIVWTGSEFVVQASIGGVDSILVSKIPGAWNPVSLQGFSGKVTGAASNGGLRVLSTYSGAYWSNNGVDWNLSPSSLPGLFGVVFYDSLFVAIQGERKILSSPDGKNWTERTDWMRKTFSSATETDTLWQDYRQILVANGELILVGTTGAFRTKNLVNWASDTSLLAFSRMATGFSNLWSANGILFVLGTAGSIWETTDFHTWKSVVSTVTSSDLYSVVGGGASWVAVGDAGTILSSKDGIAWSVQESNTKQNLRKVLRCGSTYRILAESSEILTSLNGIDWSITALDQSERTLLDFTCAGDTILVLASAGRLYKSLDGNNWDSLDFQDGGWARQIAGSGSKWVVSGRSVDVLASGDGEKWSVQDVGVANSVVLAWTGSRFVRSSGYELQSSINGETWQAYRKTTFEGWPSWQGASILNGYGVLYTGTGQLAAIIGDTDFVALGEVGANMTSLALSDSVWIAVGPRGVIKTSLDMAPLSLEVKGKARKVGVRQEGRNVRIRLPASGVVVIEMMDISGRHVNTILNERMQAGEHKIPLPSRGQSMVIRVRTQSENSAILVVP